MIQTTYNPTNTVDSSPNPCYNRAWIEGTNAMIVDTIDKYNAIKVGDLVRITAGLFDDGLGGLEESWIMGYVKDKEIFNSPVNGRSGKEIDYRLGIVQVANSDHWVYGDANGHNYSVLIQFDNTVETEYVAEIL